MWKYDFNLFNKIFRVSQNILYKYYVILKIFSITTENERSIISQKGNFSCRCANGCNDIFISGNIFLLFGEGDIEAFEIQENNDNLSLVKIAEIKNEFGNIKLATITSVLIYKITKNNNEFNFLLCTHSDGTFSIWQPGKNPLLQCIEKRKLFDSAINIVKSQTFENQIYFFMCSQDKKMKIFDPSNNLNVIKELDFEEEVNNIYFIKDYDKNDRFIVALKNGGLTMYTSAFDSSSIIPDRFNISKERFILYKSDKIIITEKDKIEIFKIIKEGSFILDNNKRMNKFNNNSCMMEEKFI